MNARARVQELIRRHRTSRSPLVHALLDELVDAIRLEQPPLPLPKNGARNATAEDARGAIRTVRISNGRRA